METKTAASVKGGVAHASSPSAVVENWLTRFEAALSDGDPARLAALFRTDGYWRNVAGLGWSIATVSGRDRIAASLLREARGAVARKFRIAVDLLPVVNGRLAGEEFVEALLRFETTATAGVAHVRLQVSGAREPIAWTFMTAVDALNGHDVAAERRLRDGTVYERDWNGPNWADRRRESARFANREPEVLVVGGGHAGLTVAAWLKALNVDTLVVDQHARVGDNWRERYHVLKLHSPIDSIHFPFMPFPATWPKYIPKDKVAGWFEAYVESMEIDYWTATSFEGAEFDRAGGHWIARLRRGDGTLRTVRPAHVIMATSQIGTPIIPKIPTLDRFGGQVLHSGSFTRGSEWSGRHVVIFGTGTSGHDLAQELHAHGAHVTMVQRGETEVIQVEPSAHLYWDIPYQGDGPPIEVRDLIACSVPLPVMQEEHRLLTKVARANDHDLLEGLRGIGFRLESDPESLGWPTKYLTRGGGYYFNVGGSDLLISRAVGLIQSGDIESFETRGLRLRNGAALECDLVLLATGYKGFDDLVPRLFGEAIAKRLGSVWGIDRELQEISNMWTDAKVPQLWFAGGSFVHSRIYSKYIALQIKARSIGLRD